MIKKDLKWYFKLLVILIFFENIYIPNAKAKALKAIGDKGVSAMICDSTNIFSPGRAGSESDVRDSLLKIMEIKTKRILVTSFASNVARMESIFIGSCNI